MALREMKPYIHSVVDVVVNEPHLVRTGPNEWAQTWVSPNYPHKIRWNEVDLLLRDGRSEPQDHRGIGMAIKVEVVCPTLFGQIPPGEDPWSRVPEYRKGLWTQEDATLMHQRNL